ncbi:benzoate/H(+) symporter BenE family transporter [Mycetohabitans sp. B8]|nr:benzoate/H(+) symporter BenE family transporter [Mycetohabitans sp. B8]
MPASPASATSGAAATAIAASTSALCTNHDSDRHSARTLVAKRSCNIAFLIFVILGNILRYRLR